MSLQEALESSTFFSGNAPFIEELYDKYLEQPDSVPESWRAFFDDIQGQGKRDRSHTGIPESLVARSSQVSGTDSAKVHAAISEKQAQVLRLIQSFRLLGHLRAKTDPINLRGLPPVPDLDPYFYGFTTQNMDEAFNTGTLIGPREMKLRDIMDVLQSTYCGSIGAEYMHINDMESKLWIQQRLETIKGQPTFGPLEKRYILELLTSAEGIERYLHTKYAGQKRFSLEGADALIPMIDSVVQQAGDQGVREVAIGMAHRGRLNVLTNIMGKAPKELFEAFEGKIEDESTTTGDVKYHEGFSCDIQTEGSPVHLALAFNPSHLEIISPVVMGSVRARQERREDAKHNQVFAVVVHGDAALAGQGVVYESLNLTQTRGFSTGGTIHIVVNNRIGFTLSHPRDLQSTLYCTDVGKVVQAPIFHVNGDDPEAVVFVSRMAVEYRMQFNRDVFIDLICYRRLGHNEADEPAATQPMMYKKIRKHDTPRKVYADRLIDEGSITGENAEDMVKIYRSELEAGRPVSENRLTEAKYPFIADWSPYLKGQWTDPAETAVARDELQRLGKRLTTLPEGFNLHPRVKKVNDNRVKMISDEAPLDWGCAECLAYASLLEEGFPIRLTGQDSARGTFFHRHSVFHNQVNGETYVPLRNISETQENFLVVDSILSEEAVLGFEYGFSTTDPKTLVIWEAQFGDFANVAQVVIDQFICSSEQKWRRLSGLVMLLPHGWEGQGPEHSSARLERFMQLCAQDNIQVCIPTTPAQMFHMLRRQMIRPYRKPLVVMSPKSTLRRKLSFSPLNDLAKGGFQLVIPETGALKPYDVKRVVICSGKVYYDLFEGRKNLEHHDAVRIAIIRLEQLYPFPSEILQKALALYPEAEEVVWCQEEPMNQGAWMALQPHIRTCLAEEQSLSYAGRLAGAAPAGGYYQRHNDHQHRLVEAALNLGREGHRPILTFEPYEAHIETTKG